MQAAQEKLHSNFMNITPGEKLEWNHRLCVVGGVTAAQVQLTDEQSGVMSVLSKEEFEQAYFSGKAKFIERGVAKTASGAANDNGQKVFECESEEDKAHARRVLKYLEAIWGDRPDKVSNKTIEKIRDRVAAEINDPVPYCYQELRKLHKRWVAADRDIRALLPRHSQKGNYHSKIHPEVGLMMEDVFEVVLQNPAKPSLKEAYDCLKEEVLKYNESKIPANRVTVPSIKTFSKHLKERCGHEFFARRNGDKEMQGQYEPTYGGYEVDRPLQRVEADTNTLDLFVNVGGKKVRPTLTLAIDVFSRLVFGYHISLKPACAENVLNCLRHAILKKPTLDGKHVMVDSAAKCKI